MLHLIADLFFRMIQRAGARGEKKRKREKGRERREKEKGREREREKMR